MGWPGLIVLGIVVGLAGWRLHPRYRAGRLRWFVAVAVGVVAAGVAKMAGSITGLFYDGGVLEWPVCTGAALLAVALTVSFASGRSTR